VERHLVQILVVVANSQLETLAAESGEGFSENSNWSEVTRS
jgi:hypothetical protein